MPPPWLELTTSDPSFSATRVNPPGTMRTLVAAGEHERPQIDMAWRDALLDESWAGGQRQRRLGDEIFRIGFQLGAEFAMVALSAVGPISMP